MTITKRSAAVWMAMTAMALWGKVVFAAGSIDDQVNGFSVEMAAHVKAVQELPSDQESIAACKRSYPADDIVRKQMGAGRGTAEFMNKAMTYQACTALKYSRPEMCAMLGQIPVGGIPGAAMRSEANIPTNSYAEYCRYLYVDWVLAKTSIQSLHNSTEAHRACMELAVRKDLNVMPPGTDARGFCDALVQHPEDVHARAVALEGLFSANQNPSMRSSGLNVSKLETLVRLYSGLGSTEQCKTLKERRDGGLPGREACLAARAYRAAERSADPDKCGSSGACRVMLGAGGSCDAYANPLRAEFCGSELGHNEIVQRRRNMAMTIQSLQSRMISFKGSSPTMSIPTKMKVDQMLKQSVDLLIQLNGASKPKSRRVSR